METQQIQLQQPIFIPLVPMNPKMIGHELPKKKIKKTIRFEKHSYAYASCYGVVVSKVIEDKKIN